MNAKRVLEENKLAIIASIICIIAVGAYLIVTAYPFVPDVFERMRIANFIIEKGSIPAFDQQILPSGAPYVYPPLVDYFLAFISIITGQPVFTAWKIAAFLIFLFFLAGFIKFCRLFLNDGQTAFAIIILFFIKIVFVRFTTYVAETMALGFFIWFLYFLYKRKAIPAGIILGLIALAHFRTFSVSILVLLIFAVFLAFKKEKVLIPFKAFAASIIIWIWWYVPNINSLLGLHNYTDFTQNFLADFLTIPRLLFWVLLIFFLVFFYFKRKSNDSEKLHFLYFIGLVPLLFVFLFYFIPVVPAPLRFMMFAMIPSVLLCAIGWDFAFSKVSKNQLVSLIVLSAVAFALFYPIIPASVYSGEHAMLADFIGKSQGKNASVLAPDTLSAFLSFKGFNVMTGAYLERIPDAEQRLIDWDYFSRTLDPKILEKYNANCFVLFRKVQTENFELKYSSASLFFYCLKS
ncbi:MAG: hypothetical protein Q7R70_06090 [Candidatus Diapherotrites archaeon]|nr:hypothetical protein [Candidatus Diapherotrites archaeon]